MEQDYQKKQIEANQKFLLKLLHLRIGNYYPLRKWLGIDFRGTIDEISHLSFAYDTKYFKKGKKWYKQQTRTYQQPDLGYKLNLVLDKIPQLSLLPALLQPAYGLGALAFFFLTQTTFQPSTKDTYLKSSVPDNNFGTQDKVTVNDACRAIIHFDVSDIPDYAVFSQGDLQLYCTYQRESGTVYANRMTRLNWTESGATWNKYDGKNAWTTAGGDYTTSNQVGTSPGGSGIWHTWNASTLIQDCFNNQSKNIHLLLYYSSTIWVEYSSKENDTTENRPKLTVTYTVLKDNSIFFSCNF